MEGEGLAICGDRCIEEWKKHEEQRKREKLKELYPDEIQKNLGDDWTKRVST